MIDKTSRELEEIIKMVETLADTTTRPMFGYQCYLVGGKFFAGFGKRNNLIIRLSKDQQSEALRDRRFKIRPFRHGARMGWIELNADSMSNSKAVFEWIEKGHNHALHLSKKG